MSDLRPHSPPESLTVEDAAGSQRRRGSGKAVFLGAALALLVLLVARNADLLTDPVHEDGDLALNSLLVRRALHLQLLVGNYSRVGFHHPGPAFLYLLAIGQAVFFDLLHLVPAPYNGQLLGNLFFTAAIVGWIAAIVERVTGSRLGAAATLAIILLFAGSHSMLADLWFPYMYMVVFALLLVSGAAVASGRTRELPAFVVAGGFLVHGHVAFIVFVTVTTLAVGVGWAVTHRHGWHEELRAHHPQLWISLGLVGLFLLPLAVQTVVHYPGPWPAYLRYVTQQEAGSGPVADALRFFGWYWSSTQLPIPLTCLAAAAGAVLLWTERVPDRRVYFRSLYILLLLESVLFAGYLIRGADRLIPLNRYIGYFYIMVPLLVTVAAAAQLAARCQDFRRQFRVVLTTAILAACLLGATGPSLHNPYRGSAAYPGAVSALDRAAQRHDSQAAVQFPHDSWPAVAGVVLEATRRGVPICLDEHHPRWTNLFTEPYICQGQQPRWHIWILSSDNPIPPHSTVIWQSRTLVVLQQPSPTLATRPNRR